MQPILRYSRSGAAWVGQPTTWLPGRTYARRVGEMGTDNSHWEWGRLCPVRPVCLSRACVHSSRVPLAGGFALSRFHKSAERRPVCRNPVGVTHPQPPTPRAYLPTDYFGPISCTRRACLDPLLNSNHHHNNKKKVARSCTSTLCSGQRSSTGCKVLRPASFV